MARGRGAWRWESRRIAPGGGSSSLVVTQRRWRADPRGDPAHATSSQASSCPRRLRCLRDLSALNRCDAVLLATPAQALRGALAALDAPARAKPLVICAKGIERGTGAFLSDIVKAAAPDASARLSFRSRVSPATSRRDCRPQSRSRPRTRRSPRQALSEALHGPAFRLYASTDLRGAEIGGAAKNVLAIACGVAEGLQLGASAKAALTARGFAELRRFATAYEARPETLMGLSGLGDLLLTCSSAQSRNFSFGICARARRERRRRGRAPSCRRGGDRPDLAKPRARQRRHDADRRCGVHRSEWREPAVRGGGSATVAPAPD